MVSCHIYVNLKPGKVTHMKLKEIIGYLEQIAPPAYQESYDNSKLLTGSKSWDLTGVLITLDSTEAVVDEAIQTGCNLIIAHHPIVFGGLKSFTGKNYVERTIIKALKHDIAIYAIHTNLDNVLTGVNRRICEKIGLKNLKILAPKENTLSKLIAFVPKDNIQSVLSALHDAGAGDIGNYSHCSFSTSGTGTFLPSDQANPAVGSQGKLESVQEEHLELIFPSWKKSVILKALKNSHPYEEVAYYMQALNNENQEVGSGMVGELEDAMDADDFLPYLKEKMALNCIRYTKKTSEKVKKIAVCGGAGRFLLPKAINSRAQIFISADFKYHEFFDADNQIQIADIGHYESEVFTKELIYDLLKEKFSNIAVNLSKIVTNPINYL